MINAADWGDELDGVKRAELPHYLDAHSGLPGPRANLALLEAVVKIADETLIKELINHGGEYQLMCAAAFFGAHADDSDLRAKAHDLAKDERWRVREGVVLGLQLLGDTSFSALATVAKEWMSTKESLVYRAIVAALCEPRLLRTAEAAALAIDACRIATESIVTMTNEQRKNPEVRVLRQTLGYCWSVAIVADPVNGLAVFSALDTSDTDVAWIVRENWRKKRLQPYSV